MHHSLLLDFLESLVQSKPGMGLGVPNVDMSVTEWEASKIQRQVICTWKSCRKAIDLGTAFETPRYKEIQP